MFNATDKLFFRVALMVVEVARTRLPNAKVAGRSVTVCA
jgi:hypothetical protein